MSAQVHASAPMSVENSPLGARAADAGRILVIEDDPDIAAVVALHLQNARYQVTVTNNGNEGLAIALRESFDLVVLDIMVPGADGLEICKRLAREPQRPIILMLTARSTELDRVLGLELGADDYLTKPFSIPELIARVRALFRRPPIAPAATPRTDAQFVTLGALAVDRWERCVRLHGVRIELTTREFDLLLWFAQHPERVFSRTELLDAVWGGGYDGFEHTVNSHLNRLRAKLESDPALPRILVTVRGAGYKLTPPLTPPLTPSQSP